MMLLSIHTMWDDLDINRCFDDIDPNDSASLVPAGIKIAEHISRFAPAELCRALQMRLYELEADDD